MDGPRDVLPRVETEMSRHREIPNRTDALGPEQLEAAHVNSSQEDDGVLRVDAPEQRPTERRGDLDLSRGQVTPLRGSHIGRLDVLHGRESFTPQQVLCHELRSRAEAQAMSDPDRRRLRRRVSVGPGSAKEPHHAGRRCPVNECASLNHRVSSFFCSLKGLQSAPALRRKGCLKESPDLDYDSIVFKWRDRPEAQRVNAVQ
jgi:hypothetical protein